MNNSELAKQLVYGNKLISEEQMKLEIFEYIAVWYNRKRRYCFACSLSPSLKHATVKEFNNQINYKNVA
ncbi:IS3 family transposase [Flavobacterium sp. W1B]|uniref:IS3 family transposase n=1 Tax=Flavobacterium sp. W1B TaxID=3394146 RepID=UPI0039BCC087